MDFFKLIIIFFVFNLPSCLLIKSDVSNNLKQASIINTELGLSYLKHGDMIKAKQKLFKAFYQNPKCVEANTALGYYFEQVKEFETARYYYQNAITLSKASGSTLNNYGVFLCKLKEYNLAEEYFLKALTDLQYYNTAKVYENAGICALENHSFANAKKYLIKALEHNPKNETALYELLNIHAKEKNYKEALALLKEKEPLNNLILSLAIDVSHFAGEKNLEQHYTNELKRFYRSNNNEYDSNFG